MTPNYKIVLFLQEKENLLVETRLCKKGEYLTEDDIEELAGWNKEIANETWFALNNSLSGLSGRKCPWCLINWESCSRCTYGKRHGRCSANIWTKIIERMEDKHIDGNSLLSNEWYEDVWTTIQWISIMDEEVK